MRSWGQKSKANSRGGFTLIEVMIATGVVSILLIGFYGAIQLAQTTRGFSDEGRRVEGWLARHVQQSIILKKLPSALSSTHTETADLDAQNGTVTDSYTDASAATGIPGLYLFTSSITYADYLKHDTTYTLSSYAYFSR